MRLIGKFITSTSIISLDIEMILAALFLSLGAGFLAGESIKEKAHAVERKLSLRFCAGEQSRLTGGQLLRVRSGTGRALVRSAAGPRHDRSCRGLVRSYHRSSLMAGERPRGLARRQ